MFRHLVGLVLVLWSARSAAAESCYPANLTRSYWAHRDILDTITATERKAMPTSREIARKWPEVRGRLWADQRWDAGAFEEFSVVYRTEKLLALRRAAWEKQSPAHVKQVEACNQRNQAEADREAAVAEEKSRARRIEMEEHEYETARARAKEGDLKCYADNCRKLQGGVWVKVGRLEDQPCPDSDESSRCARKRADAPCAEDDRSARCTDRRENEARREERETRRRMIRDRRARTR